MRFQLFSALLVSAGALVAGPRTSAAFPSNWDGEVSGEVLPADAQPQLIDGQLIVQPDGSVVAYPSQYGAFDPAVPYTAALPMEGGSTWQLPLSYDQGGSCWRGQAPAGVRIVAGSVTIRIGSAPRRVVDDRFDGSRFGPVRVFADPLSLDVIVLRDGRVHASLADSSVPFADLDGTQVVLRYAATGAQESVVLTWNPGRRAFLGRMRSASWWGSSPRSAHFTPRADFAPRVVYPSTVYPSYPQAYPTHPQAVYPTTPRVVQPRMVRRQLQRRVVHQHAVRPRAVHDYRPVVIQRHVQRAPAPPAYRADARSDRRPRDGNDRRDGRARRVNR